MVYIAKYKAPIANITLAEENNALIGLWMEGQKYYPASLIERAERKETSPLLIKTKKWLDEYFAGGKPLISELPLAPAGSEFRQSVWKILCEIPYGEVITYGDIAKKAAAGSGLEKMSAQAVGGAVGHNPISIIIPCHRVIGADGSLTGYAGGMDKKRWLLEREGVVV